MRLNLLLDLLYARWRLALLYCVVRGVEVLIGLKAIGVSKGVGVGVGLARTGFSLERESLTGSEYG